MTFKADPASGTDGFDRYRQYFSSMADVERANGDFHAEINVFRYPRMIIFDRRLSGIKHIRREPRVRRDGFNHITLHMPLSGELVAGPIGEERCLRPGEVTIVDTTLPHCAWMNKAHLLTALLPRNRIWDLLGRAEQVHGAVLPFAAGRMLTNLAKSFVCTDGELSQHLACYASEAFANIFALSLNDAPTGLLARPPRTSVSARRLRAEEFVAAHLANRQLNAEMISEAIGISRSNLYREFVEEGGVHSYVLRQRLEAARSIMKQDEGIESFEKLSKACGFSGIKHFSRVFINEFGISPKYYRDSIKQGRIGAFAPVASSDPLSRLAHQLS